MCASGQYWTILCIRRMEIDGNNYKGHRTLRNLKLGMCNVDKGKGFTVGSCNYEVVLGFIWVFNPSKEKERNYIFIERTKL